MTIYDKVSPLQNLSSILCKKNKHKCGHKSFVRLTGFLARSVDVVDAEVLPHRLHSAGAEEGLEEPPWQLLHYSSSRS